LKYAVDRSRDARIGAAAAVCAPLDLDRGAQEIDAPERAFYRWVILGALKETYAAVARRRPVPTSPSLVSRVRTMREWDTRTVVPRYGFASAEDYYARVSVAPLLGDLSVPPVRATRSGGPLGLRARCACRPLAGRTSRVLRLGRGARRVLRIARSRREGGARSRRTNGFLVGEIARMKRNQTLARMTWLVMGASLALTSGCLRKSSSEEPDGPRIFRTMCGRCHGGDGTGGVPAAEGLPAPRNFHDPEFQDTRSEADIKNVIVHGRPPSMPPFGTAFNEAELQALVRQIRQFDPRRQR
jgi:mono/diheme cytochrome c family protein